MIQLNITFFIQLVNFLILLAVLNLILYRPIRGIIKQRRERLGGYLSDIEKFNVEADAKLRDYEDALAKARLEGSRLKADYKSEGTKVEQEILARAKEESIKRLEEARKELLKQSEGVRQELSAQVEEYAKLVAEKVMA